jgi:glutamate-ammonia-ligase adenylyltransferase
MSVAAAEEYYYFRASPWHRLALMKARIVAGDKQLGQAFLNSITPFIWRQNLDYRALDELGEIKNRINLEHPSLRVQRQWREPINDQVGGFNVKLGTGGIREIEFIANALQLVWGGRHYKLRTPNTIVALQELANINQLDEGLADDLVRAYKNLRRIENAIQIQSNQHTHLIPVEEHSKAKLINLLAIDDWMEFRTNLNQDREIVSAHFEELFAEQASQAMEVIIWPNDLTAAAAEIVHGWEKGFFQYGVSNDVRQRLKPLSKALSDYLDRAANTENSHIDASAIVLRLHDFFRSLPSGEQYFRLLAESPRLLESIIPPLLYSPAMTTLLNQSPHIIDCFMGSIGLDLVRGFDSEYVVQADQYEIRLERLRRFVNEQLYQLYLSFLQGELEVERFQTALSDLAEHTLELTLRIVADHLGLSSIPITVLGMGKVALRKMSPLSDLDLIFIFDPEKTDLEMASKFVSRLQTAISAPMREGVVYELDTRLRPSGKSGAPTVSIESFANHQMNRAHTWEHIALVPSRVVAGDRSLESRINEIKYRVLSSQRDLRQLRTDAAKMWARISQHRVKEVDSKIMFSKLRPGGLMQSEYLAACLILQNQSSAFSSSASHVQFDALLQQAIGGSEVEDLSEIIQFWRIQQLWERLLGLSEQPVERLPRAYLERLLRQSRVDSLAELLSKKHRYAQRIVEACQAAFAGSHTAEVSLDEWIETKVNWHSP